MAHTALEPAARPDQHVAHVRVTLGDREGWDIEVERDGRTLLVEHVTDWHRVERRRAQLEARFAVGVAAHT